MAKEVKTRAGSLESIPEGVEIKHPLVKAIYPARSTIISSLVTVLHSSSSPSVGHRICRDGTARRRENRACEPSRRGITHTKRTTTSWAIFQGHPHVIVRLVSCIFFATLSPAHDYLLVPSLLCRTRRESFHSIPTCDASAALPT